MSGHPSSTQASRPRMPARMHSSCGRLSRSSTISGFKDTGLPTRRTLPSRADSKEDGIAAYYRACQMFPPSSSTTSSAPSSRHTSRTNSWSLPSSHTRTKSQSQSQRNSHEHRPSWPTATASSKSPVHIHSLDLLADEDTESDESTKYYLPPIEVIDWKLPETRRKEYDRIDRDNRGLRRIWNMLRPSKCSRGFYKEGDQDTDADSVRRYRMDSLIDEE